MDLKVTQPPVCSHCGEKMARQELPPVAFSDGLGWGAPFLWMCVNDGCPVFKNGFSHTLNNYGQTTSLRAIVEPDTGRESVAPAMTLDPKHIEAFVKTRARGMRNLRGEKPPSAGEEDWPAGDDYDPARDFTEI